MNHKSPFLVNDYFTYVSNEIQDLFKHEFYYGCIALSQSLAEAYARFLYERWTGRMIPDDTKEDTIWKNIKRLEEAKVEPKVGKILAKLHGGEERNIFHHLKKNIPKDRTQLKSIATKKIDLVNNLENQVFELISGEQVKYPMYWQSDEQENMHLRIETLDEDSA